MGYVMAIATVVRLENDMVMVFDENGEQVTGYQGTYEHVRDMLMHSTPTGAVFSYWYEDMAEPLEVRREAW